MCISSSDGKQNYVIISFGAGGQYYLRIHVPLFVEGVGMRAKHNWLPVIQFQMSMKSKCYPLWQLATVLVDYVCGV